MEEFVDGWVTRGWSKIQGKWEELGGKEGVSMREEIKEPDIPVHWISGLLNFMDTHGLVSWMLIRWKEKNER